MPGRSAQYTVVNRGSHLCLDADAASTGRNGQKIRGRSCDGLPAQRWTLGDSGAGGGRTLVSVPDGFCLDADAPTSGKNGQTVQGWSCAGSTNQVWKWS
ncbi:RICIN domain-containing protein [Streptomyces sp. NPDC087903]|uniref:RICIN domain-containing protein n=1 Tax=Streptomyces sp. NPDC087903 TaxID=3365819 RepID=UPI0037F9ACB1